jgi:hypothetical protein
MSDEDGGAAKLQMLQRELKVLNNVLKGVEGADKSSKAIGRLVKKINDKEPDDPLLSTDGVPAAPNHFHSAAKGQSAEGGCCVVH